MEPLSVPVYGTSLHDQHVRAVLGGCSFRRHNVLRVQVSWWCLVLTKSRAHKTATWCNLRARLVMLIKLCSYNSSTCAPYENTKTRHRQHRAYIYTLYKGCMQYKNTQRHRHIVKA